MLSRKQFGISIIQKCLLDDGYLTQRCIDCSVRKDRKFIAKYTPSVEILLKVIEQNSGKGLILPEKVVSSSGSVLVMVFDNFVIKLFQNLKTFDKVFTVLDCAYESKCNFIVKMNDWVSIEDEKVRIHAIVTEKLTPIVTYTGNDRKLDLKNNEIFKLFHDIGMALDTIHDYGYTQGDCTLDNIGRIDDRFVLFDFNCTGKIEYRNDDVAFLVRSTNFNLKEMNQKVKGFLTYVSLAKNSNTFLSYIEQYCDEYDIVI
jgi:hypothetical protein|tara:strand:- start:1632 stop:2405 length:774 start_codon:yes stop_codon:yes gene_type:complete